MSVAALSTIGSLRRRLAARLGDVLAKRGEGGGALDARLLLAHALGCEPVNLALSDNEPVTEEMEAVAWRLIERRMQGEPVARIIGRKEFWSLDLAVGPDTLVPRPDTETLVEAALASIDRAGRRRERLRLLDIGTGTGAILLALLSELPEATGIGTDRSAGALAVARDNAGRLGIDTRARFVACDWASALRGRFDLVLSNPPYIPSDIIRALPVDVREHDPHLSLDGGADGLDAFRAIVADLDRLLATNGRAFLEIGSNQADAMTAIAAGWGFLIEVHRDLGQRDRVAELDRSGPRAAFPGSDKITLGNRGRNG